MAEINLLRSLPKQRRVISDRAKTKTADHIRISGEFGELYFDGPREYGYGGYYYDGRWKSVARDIVNQYHLQPGDKVLDIGCAKGFLVKDLVDIGIDAVGIDVSEYALKNSVDGIDGRLELGDATTLKFQDKSFDLALSFNTIHNLDRAGCVEALSEMMRVAPHNGFVQVDSYRNEKQRSLFNDWVLTAKFHDYPEGWLVLFHESGYTGDWWWTIVE